MFVILSKGVRSLVRFSESACCLRTARSERLPLWVALSAVDSEEAVAAFIFIRVFHSGKDKYWQGDTQAYSADRLSAFLNAFAGRTLLMKIILCLRSLK